MPDLTTDAAMMRRQQDKDTPETIEENEAKAGKGAHDTDGASERDRRAAGRGEALSDQSHGQEDVLSENRSVNGGSEGRALQPHSAGPLASKGRSRA